MYPAQNQVLVQLTWLDLHENRDEVFEYLGHVIMTVGSRNDAKISVKHIK